MTRLMRTRICTAGLASLTIGVAIAVATTTTAATAPSGALMCRLPFPFSPAIRDSYKMIIVSFRHRKNCPRNCTQPLSCPCQWHAEPTNNHRRWLHAPACARHPAVHYGEAPAPIGDCVPLHRRTIVAVGTGECRGLGNTGGHDAHVAA